MGSHQTLLAVAILSGVLGAGAGSLWRSSTPHPTQTPTDQAGGTLPGATQAPPEVLDAVLDTAERAMLDGESTKAAAVLEAAVSDWPEDRVLWLALARIRTRLPDGAPAAYEAYQTALRLGGAEGSSAQDEFEAGTAASRAGLDEQAVEHYRSAEAIDPTDPRFPLYASQVLTRLHRSGEARAALFRATRLDEHLSIAWGSLAQLALTENRPGVALQYIAKAREQEPLVTAWRVIEARALNRLNRPAEAIAVIEGVSGGERLSTPVIRLFAQSAAMVGRPKDAAARYGEAVNAHPADGALVLEAAEWFERAGDMAEALRLARHASMLGQDRAAEMVHRLEDE